MHLLSMLRNGELIENCNKINCLYFGRGSQSCRVLCVLFLLIVVSNFPISMADDDLEWDEEDDEWYNNQKLPEVLNDFTENWFCKWCFSTILHLSRYQANTFELLNNAEAIHPFCTSPCAPLHPCVPCIPYTPYTPLQSDWLKFLWAVWLVMAPITTNQSAWFQQTQLLEIRIFLRHSLKTLHSPKIGAAFIIWVNVHSVQ